MTWDVGTRHELCGQLVCESPFHVGGWEPTATADLAVARDGLGRPVIPGTSIAGALRAWLHHADQGFTVTDLFGYIEPKTQNGKASRIRVDDALALGDPIAQVRAGVGIDRNTRTAASGFLYERELLPVGTRFTFRLVADEPRDGDPAVAAAFQALTDALCTGQVTLGASRTRGLGRVRLNQARTRSADLADRDGLRAWLTDRSPWQEPDLSEAFDQKGRLTITIDWTPAGPVLVKDAAEGALVDMLPLTATDASGRVRLLLPGSSVKGVLRSHAERIVRTLRGVPAPDHLRETLDSEAFPGIVGLFGQSPQRRPPGRPTADGDQGPKRTGWRGALDIADCHSRGHVSSEDWDVVMSAAVSRRDARPAASNDTRRQTERTNRTDRDQRRADRQDAGTDRRTERLELRQHLDELATRDDGLSLRIADHVAIDRWTGGASDSALFSVLEPMGVAWQPLSLAVDCRRAGAKTTDGDQLAVALLLLLLRDLKDGWLAFGFGTTRGHGHIDVSEIRLEGDDLPGPWAALAKAGTLDVILDDPPPEVVAAMDVWAAQAPGDVLPVADDEPEEGAR